MPFESCEVKEVDWYCKSEIPCYDHVKVPKISRVKLVKPVSMRLEPDIKLQSAKANYIFNKSYQWVDDDEIVKEIDRDDEWEIVRLVDKADEVLRRTYELIGDYGRGHVEVENEVHMNDDEDEYEYNSRDMSAIMEFEERYYDLLNNWRKRMKSPKEYINSIDDFEKIMNQSFDHLDVQNFEIQSKCYSIRENRQLMCNKLMKRQKI